MERLQVLINKLVEQNSNGESPARMLVTVQLLQNELVQLQQRGEKMGTKNVAVIMPAPALVRDTAVINQQTTAAKAEEKHTNQEESETPTVIKQEEQYESDPYPLHQTVAQEEEKKETPEVTAPETTTTTPFPYNPVEETPTFLQQSSFVKEIHEMIGERRETLNDLLKQDRSELAHVLKETPVKDLRKAIGINDKFVFVHELFRGDEGMYERSIKTINSFQILPEAEYWINRELKVKLGWNDSKESVQHFYQLVRRRFS